MADERDARSVRDANFATWGPAARWSPQVIVRAESSRFWDSSGKEYLDFASQLVATNLGHGNEAVARAISDQARRLAYAAPGFATEARAQVGEALRAVLPSGLEGLFFSTSGTEANEAALRMARAVTGRAGILAQARSYHGSTSGSLSVSGDLRRTAAGASSEVPGTVFVPNCYCYRCPLSLTYPGCGVACADEVERAIEHHPDVAAMIVEPVVGTNGVIVPVTEYLPKVREITRRHDVLLIADEVMTGWGRTGRWFAVEHFGVDPDILTTAKGITGGYVPLGLTATSRAVRAHFEDRFLPAGHTYSAHPVALAAAVAAIGEYERQGLVEKSRRDGQRLLDRLRTIQADHPSVGDVRGLGLFAAVELVQDRSRKTPFNTEEDKRLGTPLVVDEVAARMRSEGVYVLSWVNHLLLAPPLIVTPEELDQGLDALDDALAVSDGRVSSSGRSRNEPSGP